MDEVRDAQPADRLRADCARCVGLCCVVPAFSVSSEFGIDKPPRTPCPNLLDDFRCGIHADLRVKGFSGCASYDCFGAGQFVTQVAFGGRDWRDRAVAESMFATFEVVRGLHELMWHVREATLLADPGTRAELTRVFETLGVFAAMAPDDVVAVPLDALWVDTGPLLQRVSASCRADYVHSRLELAHADLLGLDLRDRDLRGADLRGATLVAADLRGVDLALADLATATCAVLGSRVPTCRPACSSPSPSSTRPAVARRPRSLAGCAAQSTGPRSRPRRPVHWAT